jgi:hypothetical protein
LHGKGLGSGGLENQKKFFFLKKFKNPQEMVREDAGSQNHKEFQLLRKKIFFDFPGLWNPPLMQKNFFLRGSKNWFHSIEDHEGISKLNLFVLEDQLEGPKGQIKIQKMAFWFLLFFDRVLK